MHRLLILFLVILSYSIESYGQAVADTARMPSADTGRRVVQVRTVAADTTRLKDTATVLPAAVDSIVERPLVGMPQWEMISELPFAVQIMRLHPFFDFKTRPFVVPSNLKVFKGKETLFYVIMALVLAFALLKLAFAKYFSDLFRVFFQTTMKQRQIREQLMQTPVASLGFNIFFLSATGLYVNFLLFHFNVRPVSNFWVLYLYCCAGLAAIYVGKFLVLKLCGWMFNVRQAADSYIFIVFIINKVIGIFLLPFLALLAFSAEPMRSIALTLSWAGIGMLFLYRFILGYAAARNEVRFNLFHFLLYILAFEAAPLLLIYRLLLFFFK
ncbi:DUF4271 domain-containing protein [Terrimonas sp. NA20]|uniref:DUF4271 domain-containing protein n=1 Tax=Terrimonas ginsenosidimutans TaxID=2908004 RepID=A0ABS9KPB2_9BACT|nr:DUF4271 domain-containing protein [Terrimonas ginsenosidimutans]MCG2614146.1 DUF4271 domain-containing protein [Terrimonas ginsenosidimutans]